MKASGNHSLAQEAALDVKPFIQAAARLTGRAQSIGGMAAILLVLVLATVSISRNGTPTLRSLTDTYPSIDALISSALVALASGDEQSLHALRLTRFEHDSLLVPAMSGGKPRTGSDMEFAWFLLDQNNQKGIRRAVADYGGLPLALKRITFVHPSEVYGRYTLHRGIQVEVRDNSASEEYILPIFGAIIEEDGHYKLVSIRD